MDYKQYRGQDENNSTTGATKKVRIEIGGGGAGKSIKHLVSFKTEKVFGSQLEEHFQATLIQAEILPAVYLKEFQLILKSDVGD